MEAATDRATAGEKVVITQFSDPMMGLAWECEPALRKVETHFAVRVEFRDVMGVLVRDVGDFMTAQERALPPEQGIAQYNRRLARIRCSRSSRSARHSACAISTLPARLSNPCCSQARQPCTQAAAACSSSAQPSEIVIIGDRLII